VRLSISTMPRGGLKAPSTRLSFRVSCSWSFPFIKLISRANYVQKALSLAAFGLTVGSARAGALEGGSGGMSLIDPGQEGGRVGGREGDISSPKKRKTGARTYAEKVACRPDGLSRGGETCLDPLPLIDTPPLMIPGYRRAVGRRQGP